MDCVAWQCSECLKSYKSKRGLLSHIKRIHDVVRPFKCSLCPRSFSAKSLLNQHVFTHTREQPYKCSYCGMQFNTSGNRNRHVQTKHIEGPATCIFCNERPLSLLHHMTMHTREYPYLCRICGKELRSKSYMSKHVKLHTMIHQRKKCLICAKTFAKKSTYRIPYDNTF